MQSDYKQLADLVLPTGILDFFDLNEIKQEEQSFHFYLEELPIRPVEYSEQKLTSKGFFNEIEVRDFPIRGKDVYLHIKRRRWENQEGASLSRNWELVAKGTRITKEFAAFLKVISGY